MAAPLFCSMTMEDQALAAFHRAAASVPAYRTILQEAGIEAGKIQHVADFSTLPILDKAGTFQRFPIEELCRDGEVGRLGSVLTSSGHSGIFAFGLNDAATLPAMSGWIDDLLDLLFAVRSKRTLLINCLPMGVKVPTQACTLAETSVRPDMTVALVKSLGRHFSQIILVGEAAFIKHVLELGRQSEVDWKQSLVHVILGEEPLAENARKYFEAMIGTDPRRPEDGVIASSMGVAEIGLNLFSEIPPASPLIALRRLLHENAELRGRVLGPGKTVPSLFTYDPRRIFTEFDSAGRLVLTTLDPYVRIPLVRYATGDRGRFLSLPEEIRPSAEAAGISWTLLQAIPIVAITGRGEHASAGEAPVYPEEVKEGIYHDHSLAPLTTANFRLVSGATHVRVRIQLSRGISRTVEIEKGFRAAIAHYVAAPIEVVCEPYETFVSGMSLDYERKFSYLAR